MSFAPSIAASPVFPVRDQVIDDFRLNQSRCVTEIIDTFLGDLAYDAATRFGVSVENVVATIDASNNHQGMF